MDRVLTSVAITSAQKLTVVGVADVKDAMKITNAREDAFITRCILTAYDMLSGPDGMIGHAPILQEEWSFYLDSACGDVEIPLRPFVSLTSFSSIDGAGVYQPITATLYSTYGDGLFQHLKRFPSAPYPISGILGHPRAYRMVAIGGFAPVLSPDLVPNEIKTAIHLLAGHFYVNREQVMADNRVGFVSRQIEMGVQQVLGRLMIHKDHS
jgi:uncharacterized phiE125 gp8 family phage protein